MLEYKQVYSWPFVSVKKKKWKIQSGLFVRYLLFSVGPLTVLLQNQHFLHSSALFSAQKWIWHDIGRPFLQPTFESDISLTFQTCHNSTTDKIIGTLIDNTNNWDLQSDFFCFVEPVGECSALSTCTCSLWWALTSNSTSGMPINLLKKEMRFSSEEIVSVRL